MEKQNYNYKWQRDFSLNALPRNQNGEVLYRGFSDEEYLSYVGWLANYLYDVQFQPTKEQNLICNFVLKCQPEVAMERVAENAAFYDSDVIMVLCKIERENDSDGMDDEDISFFERRLEYVDVPQILKEEAELLEHCPEAEEDFCDVGWRTPLSAVLKNIPDADERIRLLRLFFSLYQEYSCK